MSDNANNHNPSQSATAGQVTDKSSPEYLHAMRHSLAHITASAVQDIWPKAKFGVGPVVEHGFYYDIDLGENQLSDSDFDKITARMQELIKADESFERFEMTVDEAIRWSIDNDQPYKHELLNDLKRAGTTVAKDLDTEELGLAASDDSKVDNVSFYRNGDFTDLCRGPHVASTGKVGAFKLMRVSGAYWRGSEKNAQMQRIYGTAFATPKELRQHLEMLEEAKKRDHRKLGKDLELFFFHETAPGMPYWLPNGVLMYNELVQFWREEHRKRGYQEIVSPLLNRKDLYETSGHYQHYWDDMFTSETKENEEYGVKPMNCPNAMLVFKHKQRSYKELPLRLGDTDTLHRYELSGALNGLLRVREFRQDDAHIFVSEEQIKEEYARVFEITERFYSIFGMEYSYRLGTRPEKFMGEADLWDKAEATLKEVLEESGKEYFVEEGDGAFYGPKIDILMKDVLGRPWQMGTIQLDFQQPIRFDLKYAASDGTEKTPIAIHRVIYGSLERFIGILIEHTAGRFPIWLAPEQVRLVTVNQEASTTDLAESVVAKATDMGLRVTVDNDNESVGKKIRNAELMKVPYTVVIGDKEIETGQFTPRIRKDLAAGDSAKTLSVDDFLAAVATEARSRSATSTLA